MTVRNRDNFVVQRGRVSLANPRTCDDRRCHWAPWEKSVSWKRLKTSEEEDHKREADHKRKAEGTSNRSTGPVGEKQVTGGRANEAAVAIQDTGQQTERSRRKKAEVGSSRSTRQRRSSRQREADHGTDGAFFFAAVSSLHVLSRGGTTMTVPS